ncbi:MLt-TeN (mlt-10) related [Caenorhabditis elegans]|nr:MLt-TeN (mlt-10) related [Caenorhabditis elegans]CTQ86937.1 MLt-TeN (mlt-10) related [Caenorhabditis elegans]|eukprot:NP_001300238.1 MLt-TeN (mlt-10) related [Caenorhabditis elegans]
MTHDGNKTIVKISEEATYQLIQKWVDQAASGFMMALMSTKLKDKRLEPRHIAQHNNCTQVAKSITEHAQCVVTILKRLDDQRRKIRKFKKLKFRRSQLRRARAKRDLPETYREDKERVVQQKQQYELKGKKEMTSPFSLIAKTLTDIVRENKNKEKEPKKKWQTVINEIKDELNRIKQKKKDQEDFRNVFSKYSRTMKMLGLNPETAFRRAGLDSIGEEISAANTTGKLSEEEQVLKKPLMMIRDGVKLGMMLTGQNVSNFDDRKIALMSPQFMSVLPDEQANDTVNLLSPSVFALHESGSELDQMLSLSRAMRFLSENGHDDWMNFVLEASGVTEAVEKMRFDERKQEMEAFRKHFSNENGQPMYFTRQNVSEMYGDYKTSKIDSMEKLHKSMSAAQMHEMNSTGYAIMSSQQISEFYGPGSPYNDSHAYENYRNLRRNDIPDILENNIHQMAREEQAFKVARQKDVVLSPLLFTWITLAPKTASQPIVLSPLVFSPLILSPSALGPLILSPWIFSPLILSPRVLAPIILSPTIFSPIILSPLALSPLILSPAVADPLILSPFVLTPFILSPLVMVPLILNPFCLSPLLGVPNTLSPIILSPFVLSPFVLSPPYVNAFVLSPYFLSPIVLSDGLLFTAVLSPSFLSSL